MPCCCTTGRAYIALSPNRFQPHTFLTSLGRSTKSQMWPIHHRGGEALLNPSYIGMCGRRNIGGREPERHQTPAAPHQSVAVCLINTVHSIRKCNDHLGSTVILLCMNVFWFGHWHAFLRHPWVVCRALGCGVRRGLACTRRHKFRSRAGSVARALGVQRREYGK